MNPYTEYLNDSLVEIDEFSNSDAGKEWDQDWYKHIKRLVLKAANEEQDRAEEIMDMISWAIVDSGPLSSEFAPSFSKAQEALVKARRHREIIKHKKA